jgi:pimeloyl-ACP methyl ester carboxylesterase
VREPDCYRVHANGIELALYEWRPERDLGLPPVFLAHATGFHARCWDQVAAALPEFRVLAIDMRGHGRSDRPAPPYDWRFFGEDVAAVAAQLGLEGAIGAGHSKGGHALIIAAAHDPARWSALLLVDPVVMPREFYGRAPVAEHFAARRRDHWSSPDEMFERFKDRPPFVTWQPQVLRDYCEHGLVPDPAGAGYVLACPPAIEAAVYAGSTSADPYPYVARVQTRVRVLRARRRGEDPLGEARTDMSSSPTAPDLASHFARGEDVYLPDYSHFMAMEDPGLIARHIRELAGGAAS